MDDNLKEKILAEINKSGFPLELELTAKLRSEDHILVFSNITFQSDDKSIKEIDIIAVVQDEENEWSVGPVGTQILIECKKSEKYPWVFFEEVHDPLSTLGLLYRADSITDLKLGFTNALLTGANNTDLSSHYYNDLSLAKTKTYFEAFKSSNDSIIYKAIMNIFHGRKYLANLFVKQFEKRKTEAKSLRTFLKQYLIVLDGQLLLASKTDNDFEIAETNHIILKVRDTISNDEFDHLGDEILIDIIKREYFDTYINLSKKGVNYFNRHLKSIRHSGFFESIINNQSI